MIDLSTIWSNRLNLIAENLRLGEREYREIAAIAQHVGWDYHGRCLIELIQNAADQATIAGIAESAVTVIRTSDLLAVINEGRPLDDDGVRAMTALAFGTKDPSVTIGNKGLGFKAVFQVSESPEVFSAPVRGGGLLADGGYRFAFSPYPLENAELQAVLRQVAKEFEARDPVATRRLSDEHGMATFSELLLSEVRRGAPFRFPLPLQEEHLRVRIGELGLTGDQADRASALVVLPLRASSDVQQTVNTAWSELVEDVDSATLLFLTGIATLRFGDQTTGVTHVLERGTDTEPRFFCRSAGVGYVTRRTTRRTVIAPGAPFTVNTRHWWVCSRTLGRAEDSDEVTAAEERRSLRKAVAELPGDQWGQVDRAAVSVALPIPITSAVPPAPLGTSGVFCIGLPTQMRTGMPIWVNARFHANIARTQIDLMQSDYNRILFDEATDLVAALVRALKTGPDVETRRLATLALESSPESVLGVGLRGRSQLLEDETVLAADGRNFIRGTEVSIPRERDAEIFQLLTWGDEGAAGFALADNALMRNARHVLRQLGASEGPPAGPDWRYLARGSDGTSVVERAATRNRRGEPAFWDQLLSWLVDQYSGAALASQRVLPTGESDLTASQDKVYAAPLLPHVNVSGHTASDERKLDLLIAERLHLIDEACVRVREIDKIRYTRLGTRLRQSEPPLVRDPVLADLVRDVFGPLVQELAKDAARWSEAIWLVRLVAEWARARDIKDVSAGSLRVPVTVEGDGGWQWGAPNRVYLGAGWSDADTSARLARAYGARPSGLLINWPEFARIVGAEDRDRDSWVEAFGGLGVRGRPRVLIHAHTATPFQAYSYGGPLVRTSLRCPPALAPVTASWVAYLDAIRHRKTAVCSGQPYEVERLLWLDGLEVEDSRADVVALVLQNPDEYSGLVTTRLWRADAHTDSTEIPALWVHAIRNADWRTIPTTHGLSRPSAAWLLTADQRRNTNTHYRFLPCITEQSEAAQRLLVAFGVATLNDAPPERYVRALQLVAERLHTLTIEEMNDAIVLTEELYRHLQTRLSAELIPLPVLLERAIPMFDGIDGRRLTPVQLRDCGALLVNDNPVRARLVVGARSTAVLPVSPRRGQAALVAAIVAQIGQGVVRYTGSEPVDLAFVANATPDTTVAAYLERAYAGRPLRRDIGLLLSTVPAGASEPLGERARHTLARFDAVRLRFGRFASPSDLTSFFDEFGESGATLLVEESMEAAPHQVFAAAWELAGAHRDTWASYAAALRDNTTERFLSERGVTAADRHEVEILLTPDRDHRYESLKADALAVALRYGVVANVDEFETQWPQRAASADAIANFVGCPELADLLALAVSVDDREPVVLRVLERAGVSVDDWQAARALLRLPLHEFAASRRAYETARAVLIATLMGTAAHALSVDLDLAREWIEDVEHEQPAPALLYSQATDAEMLRAVTTWAEGTPTLRSRPGLAVLRSRVESALRVDDTNLLAALQATTSQRETDEYRLPAQDRTARAERDVGIILGVARLIAAQLGENADAITEHANDRLSALTRGWWANRFAVLDVLRLALQDVAPTTTRRLVEARAFRDVGPPGSLAARIPEVSSPEPSRTGRGASAAETVSAVGVNLERAAMDADLARGSEGLLGEALRRGIGEPVKFATLRQITRPAAPRQLSRARPGRGRSSHFSMAELREERELNGLLGEAFVYELFRGQLPSFDYDCWRSTAAVRYGVASAGDDGLGADFVYRDSSGLLTGRADSPEVYLEVKATSAGGAAPFEMSAGEWETALRFDVESSARVYAIVRVEFVRTTPALHRIYVNPARLSREGFLIVDAADLRITGA